MTISGPRAKRPHGVLRRLGLLTSAVLVAALAPLQVSASTASAAAALPDGLSSRTAAGSCWEIKQNNPSAPDGVYWLVTPALQAPQQFYCDQTTNGGGWVLVGRGRNGWKINYAGLRTPAEVSGTVTGPGAFAPAELPSETIDGLLNGARVDSLADGIRLRRAMDTAGTSWQEVRFKLAKRDRWVWTMPAENPVGSYSFASPRTTTGSGGQTAGFGLDSSYQRVSTAATQTQGYLWGFGYGANVRGYSSASSYLWSKTDGAGSAEPFTQVYLRPQLRLSAMSFPAVPDSGTAAQTQRALPESDAMRTVWGVSGLADGIDSELHTEVQAFAQVGSTVFVGGNFQYVQRDAAGTDQVQQPFLAGFDVDTGEWVSSFRPVLNGQVKALVALPDGRLGVGGDFSQVDGTAHSAFVGLDPATGAVTGWQLDVQNRTSGGLASVRNFSIQDGYLYLSGSFTHLVQGSVTGSGWNGGRVNSTTGRPDTRWNPKLNGTSVGVDASDAGDRVYFSGYFNLSGSVSTPSDTALQTSANAPVVTPVWTPQFSKSSAGHIWQLDVQEVGNRVYSGGSEHMLFGYDRSTLALKSGSIMKSGGDVQVIDHDGDNLYAGCHCGDFSYQDAYAWSSIGSSWTQADSIATFGAWDAATGNRLPEFDPIVKGRKGYGAWAMMTDSRGNLWVGGDYKSSIRAGYVNQWSGGFMRFAPRDTAAPSTPAGVTSTDLDGSRFKLTWSASSDDRGVAGYEVIEGNKVIATTTTTSLVLGYADTAQRYFVRAVDAAGNRSASTAVLTVSPPAASVDLVAAASTWKYRFDGSPVPADWTSPTFDDSAWASGSSVLGFGSTGLGTDLAVGAPSPRPLSIQYRQAFTVTNTAALTSVKVSVVADDGVVVYVNGTEIGRANLPTTGTIGQNSYATKAPRTSTALADPVVMEVPTSLLHDGTNVVAAETHMNYRSTPDSAFRLAMTGTS